MTTESRDREHTWTEAGPVLLRDDERIDDLERNGYGIIQRKGAFCFGMDAVLLSGFAVVKPAPARGSSPFCWRPRPRAGILPAWRFSRSRRTWPAGAWLTTAWRKRWRL